MPTPPEAPVWRGARHVRLLRTLGQAVALTLCALGWLVIAPAEATRTTTQMHAIRDAIRGTDYEYDASGAGVAILGGGARTTFGAGLVPPPKATSGRYLVTGTPDEALRRLFMAAELTDVDEPSCLRRIGRDSYVCNLTRRGFTSFGWVTIGSRPPSPGVEGERLVVVTYKIGPDARPRVIGSDSLSDYEPLATQSTP